MEPVANIVQTLHEKGDLSLVKIRYPFDGRETYGVVRTVDGGPNIIEFTGTKAEAKEFYGNWRSR